MAGAEGWGREYLKERASRPCPLLWSGQEEEGPLAPLRLVDGLSEETDTEAGSEVRRRGGPHHLETG